MRITVRETNTRAVWVIHHAALQQEQAVCICDADDVYM